MFSLGDLIDDRYEVVGQLGQGGMAHVFRARDRHLEREVALKVLRPHLAESDSHRFRREIQALARFDHPGIVSIFDLGLGSYVYFVMELIEGGPFTDLGPLEYDAQSLESLLGAAITVADALAYVHRLGMVHRDITPRNILLTHENHPKVMDFGLVQLTEASQHLTRTGMTLGTPHYMSPEQARGEGTGAQTDLYSFGVVLYRTVTGQFPFDAENDQAVLYKHVYDTLIPADELNPSVPRELSELISSLLEKDPAHRPSSAAAFADSLRSVQAEAIRRSTHLPHGGTSRSGYYAIGPARPQLLERLWQVSVDEGPQWPAGVGAAQGYILLGLRSDEAVALRAADGAVVGSFTVPDEVSSAPLYSNGRLYILSRDGGVFAVSWPKGDPLWSNRDLDAVGLQPHGDRLLVTSGQGALVCFAKDLEPLWRYEAGSPATTPPVVHRGAAAFATADGWLHLVDTVTGGGKLKIEVGALLTAPVASAGVLLLPVRTGELHGFDIEKREVLWTYDVDGEIYGAPAVWDGRVYLSSWGRTLHCVSLRSGDDLWEATLDAPITASPVVAAGVVYVVTENGEVLAYDARCGEKLWRERISHAPIQASPLPLGSRLIVASLDGTVTAFG